MQRQLIGALPHYYSIAEAAAVMRCSSATVGRLVREGRLRSHRVGGRQVLLERAEVETLSASRRPDDAA